MVSPIPAGGDEIGELVARLRAVRLSSWRSDQDETIAESADALEQLQRERVAANALIPKLDETIEALRHELTTANARISALEAQLESLRAAYDLGMRANISERARLRSSNRDQG